ncbi:hypothetical protein A3B87_01020 [Candidatus Kuenenbacteria bacterium RIFCSPHIGHO2_02_FULL_39_13]|uniref:Glycosyltransferase 2-like domain-containing protein n=1 Tax=Candidatus Kuenenbacteria bacterium RIFCSPHIGHO2_02_FULL_39_13 TaxID=1798561 RepID=A0A1F6FP87_9BACT|nr:MAG: hypothetical protein A3B87_01020 [Candidatus Kuenenbacteria bacterium RIFCSPHIGHO2_02_FULL_39_13]
MKKINNMPEVYVIIATWNSEKYLSDLFLSLHDMDYPKDSWHLVVVDNGSRDKTLEILSAWQVKMHNFETVIYNEANKGFAAANNQGITYALKNSPDYIVLLNDDIVVEPNWLNVMIDKMEQNKDIGLAQPLITRYPEINKINTFGNACQFIGFGFCWLEGQDINLTLKNYQPAYLSFSAVVIRSEVFRQIGLLDENYFSYHEDSDFCFRARLQDWNLLAVKGAIVHHRYKFPGKKNKIRYFWLEKNRYYLMLKFFKLKTLFLIAPACLFMEAGQTFFSIIRGLFIQKIKAYFWILKNFDKILTAREKIQQTRKFSDKKLFDFMSGKIEFQEIKNPLLDYIGNPLLNLYFKIIKKFI